MKTRNSTRRRFLAHGAAALAGAAMIPYVFTADAEDRTRPRGKNDRLRIGAIGMRYQGSVITEKALPYGDVVAIADVDRTIAEKAREQFGGQAELYEDYRGLLDRPDVDVVMIGAPDHWHTAMAVAACRAGKDVYCEKPLTLTIDEGKLLRRVVNETGAVLQVGSWQRSDHRYRLAVEMVRSGRIGKLRRVDVVLGKNQVGGPFASTSVPKGLNWDLWLGQAPAVDYAPERCHYTFRWWYEYAGGQLTDWGAHHLDIAQWGIGCDESGPLEILGRGSFPQPGGYNVAESFEAVYQFPDGVEMTVKDEGRNGVMFEGDEGRIFVNRGALAGKPVDDLADRPLDREDFVLYAHDNLDRPPRSGKLEAIENHMGNFFDCVRSRARPISDVETQHRAATACHLGNISLRLGRKLAWDPAAERLVGDDEANTWLAREQRKGYELPT